MEINDVLDLRHELLEQFVQELNDNLTPAGILEVTTEDEPEAVEFMLDELANSSDEVRGYVYFDLPQTPEDEVQHLTCMFSLSEDLKEATLPALYAAVCHINFALPFGGFAVDVNNRFLSYKLCAPLSMEMSREALYDEICILAGNASEVVSSFHNVLMKVIDGDWDIEKVVEYLGG